MTRTGRTVHIDVTGGVDISDDARTAMIAATMEHLLDEDVRLVQLDGSAFVETSRKGLPGPWRCWNCSPRDTTSS